MCAIVRAVVPKALLRRGWVVRAAGEVPAAAEGAAGVEDPAGAVPVETMDAAEDAAAELVNRSRMEAVSVVPVGAQAQPSSDRRDCDFWSNHPSSFSPDAAQG
jgi:hypothetical protein